jgi:murein peptide amidase A
MARIVVWGSCLLMPAVSTAQSLSSGIRENSGAVAQSSPSSRDGYAPHDRSRWNVLGRSVEERVIEYRQFGQGNQQVLVVGPLEGDETAALELVELLAEHLEQFPRRTDGVKVTLVRDPNPDGRLRRSPLNARGVRLDQNFPTRGWHKVPAGANWLSGREPESEPETKALVDLVADVRPDRVIVLAATRRQADLTYFGPAEELARDFAKASGLRPAAANVAAQPGSLAAYTGGERKTPTLLLRVPAAMRRDQLWSTYKRSLLATIGGDSADAVLDVGENRVVTATNGVPTALATVKRAAQNESSQIAKVNTPRVFSADELQADGELVPVLRPTAVTGVKSAASTLTPSAPRTYGPATPQAHDIRRFPQAASKPAFTARPSLRGGIPPAALFRPNQSTARPSSPAVAPTDVVSPETNKVDRLPAIDPALPATKTLPQPIPLYPSTGY